MRLRAFSSGIPTFATRLYSNRSNIEVQLERTTEDAIRNKEMKARKHPGVMSVKNVAVPLRIVKAVDIILCEEPVKNILRDSVDLDNYLQSRHPPNEFLQLRAKTIEVFSNLAKNEPPVSTELSQQEMSEILKRRELQAQKIMKKVTYNWMPIKYEKYQCHLYLMARAAPEFASLCRIFDEIKHREPDFKPDSFFDFGSGVGTGLWAVRQFWEHSILEYFTVDISQDMNDLAKLILCDGNENKQVPLKSFFQRQFLPVSSSITYDIVLIAYSLFELQSAKSRLETIGVLWRKTNKFLILVEQGTNAGFRLLNEARDYILSLKDEGNIGHVFAPCPGDFACPRFAEGKTPCNFMVMFSNLGIGQKHKVQKDFFSYLILKKGKRSDDDPSWPRIVRSPMVKSKHTICRLCTAEGKLEEITFTKRRHGQPAYWCARSSSWGDLLPMNVSTSEKEVPDDCAVGDDILSNKSRKITSPIDNIHPGDSLKEDNWSDESKEGFLNDSNKPNSIVDKKDTD